MRFTIRKKPLVSAMSLVALIGLQDNSALGQSRSKALESSTPVQVITLEEVMVRAQRREESLQDISVSVTAIGQEQLQFQQINNVGDIQFLVPNLSLATNTGLANGARTFLRGIGEDDSRVTVDPAVAMYVDDVYIGRQIGALFDLVDVKSVEVLRGPQGTLYGRNSNGGAIKIQSVKPDIQEYSLNVTGSVGNEGLQEIKANGNIPINDMAAIQLAVLDKHRDALFTFENSEGDVGAWNSFAYRISGLVSFDNSIEVQLTYDNIDDDSDPIPASYTERYEKEIGLDGDVFTTVLGDNELYYSETEQDGLSLQVSGELASHEWKYIGSKRTMENELGTFIIGEYTHMVDQEQLSHELQVTSNLDGRFNYVAGIFYFDEEVEQDYVFFGGPYDINLENEAVGAYGQAFINLTSKLDLTAGLRYTKEDKSIDATGLFAGFFPQAADESEDYSNTDYKVALDYAFTDEMMAYVSYATGFKSGGWSPDTFDPIDEETVETIEIGMKSEWLDRRLRLNATYFMNDYEDLQLNGTTSDGFTRFNVPEVETSGVELELTYLVTADFRLYSNVGYLDGDYVKLSPDIVDTIPNTGVSLKNAPQWVATVGGDYTFNLGSAGSLRLGIDIAYEEESYSTVSNNDLTKMDDKALYNARIAWDSADEHFQIIIWGKNLSDEVYYPASTDGPAPGAVYAGDPRTYGVDFTYRM